MYRVSSRHTAVAALLCLLCYQTSAVPPLVQKVIPPSSWLGQWCVAENGTSANKIGSAYFATDGTFTFVYDSQPNVVWQNNFVNISTPIQSQPSAYKIFTYTSTPSLPDPTLCFWRNMVSATEIQWGYPSLGVCADTFVYNASAPRYLRKCADEPAIPNKVATPANFVGEWSVVKNRTSDIQIGNATFFPDGSFTFVYLSAPNVTWQNYFVSVETAPNDAMAYRITTFTSYPLPNLTLCFWRKMVSDTEILWGDPSEGICAGEFVESASQPRYTRPPRPMMLNPNEAIRTSGLPCGLLGLISLSLLLIMAQ